MNRNVRIMMISVVAAGVAVLWLLSTTGRTGQKKYDRISPERGEIASMIVTTGLIQPQNRLEIRPSIAGRVEEILVREGDRVFAGEILARMSSTDRATLIDTARLESPEALEYWEEAYRKTPLIAPIDGQVIARNVEPGQTVSNSDVVLVLSDRLVVKAQFDETDIGRVRKGQHGSIMLDAYPDIKLEGVVDHIAYESEIINNVTVYNVDIRTKEIPEILRSGMSATVELIEKVSPDAMILPFSAVQHKQGRTFVLVETRGKSFTERDVEIGIVNGNRVEIISGIGTDDKILVPDTMAAMRERRSGVNPFMPSRRR